MEVEIYFCDIYSINYNHTIVCAQACRTLRGFSASREKTPQTTYDEKPQDLQLLTFKPVRRQKQVKDPSARELVRVYLPSVISWVENLPLR